MKFYKRRDSATSFMRKLGIKPRDYDLFITKTEDGVEFNVELAKQHATKLKAQATPKRRPKAKTAESDKTCCAVACDLVIQGYSNQAIWEVIQPMFNLDDKKRHYPSWYRCYMRRIGKLPQETRINKVEHQVVYE